MLIYILLLVPYLYTYVWILLLLLQQCWEKHQNLKFICLHVLKYLVEVHIIMCNKICKYKQLHMHACTVLILELKTHMNPSCTYGGWSKGITLCKKNFCRVTSIHVLTSKKLLALNLFNRITLLYSSQTMDKGLITLKLVVTSSLCVLAS